MAYPKASTGDSIKGDQPGEMAMRALTGRATGGGSSGLSGPTISSRSYPKGSSVSKDAGRLNPQKVPVTGNYVGGVG